MFPQHTGIPPGHPQSHSHTLYGGGPVRLGQPPPPQYGSYSQADIHHMHRSPPGIRGVYHQVPPSNMIRVTIPQPPRGPPAQRPLHVHSHSVPHHPLHLQHNLPPSGHLAPRHPQPGHPSPNRPSPGHPTPGHSPASHPSAMTHLMYMRPPKPDMVSPKGHHQQQHSRLVTPPHIARHPVDMSGSATQLVEQVKPQKTPSPELPLDLSTKVKALPTVSCGYCWQNRKRFWLTCFCFFQPCVNFPVVKFH